MSLHPLTPRTARSDRRSTTTDLGGWLIVLSGAPVSPATVLAVFGQFSELCFLFPAPTRLTLLLIHTQCGDTLKNTA